MPYLQAVWDELQGLVNTTLGLSGSMSARAMTAERIPWRQLLDEYEQTGTGLPTPFLVLENEPARPSEWAMDQHTYELPVTIYLIESARPTGTTVVTGATSATQTLASTAGMYVGQALKFRTANRVAKILTLPGGGVVTLDTSITTVTAEPVLPASVPALLEYKLEPVRDALLRGLQHTTFQVIEDPVLDVSTMNPANQVFAEGNYPLYAGAIQTVLLVGEE